MEYKSTVTVSVTKKTRTSGFNSDGTMRDEAEGLRTAEQVKRIINLPADCVLERGKYHLKLWQGEEESIPAPESLEDVKFLMDFFQANKAVLEVSPDLVPRFKEIAAKLKGVKQ